MIEFLSPVVSLFKLIIDSLEKVSGSIRSTRKKQFFRKIIELQLCLEDIIDRAENIISFIEDSRRHKIAKKDLDQFQRLLYKQNQKLYNLTDILSDDAFDEIMTLFAPETKRKIWMLINLKGGFIQEVVRRFHSFEQVELINNEITIKTKLLEWNHDTFLEKGHSYLTELEKGLKKASIPISNRQQEQEQIVKALINCSSELSEFIKSQVKVEDVIIRKKRQDPA